MNAQTSKPGGTGTALTCASVRPSRRTSRSAFAGEEPDPLDPLLSFPPYLHAAPRGNSITPERQRAFIARLAATGIVTQAARHIGASLEALYRLRQRPGAEGFSAAWDMAIDRGIARLEDCALELAIRGEELPIVSAGKLLGTYRKHNFGHIRFVLSQRRADRWASESNNFSALRPGHPVYDRLKREWEKERAIRSAADSERIVLSLNAKLEGMRQRMLAAQADPAMDGDPDDGDYGGDGGDDGEGGYEQGDGAR